MAKFLNTKFDLEKKVTFSIGRMVFLLASAFSIGVLCGLAIFLVKNQDFLITQPQVLPASKPAISPSPSPTVAPISDNIEGWQIYRNGEYGFEIKYPSDWKIIPDNAVDFQSFDFQSKNEKNNLQIVIFNYSDNQTLKQYLETADEESQIAYEGDPSKEVLSTKEIIIAGLSGIQREEEWYAAGFTTVVTYLIKDNSIYHFRLLNNTDGYYTENGKKIYDQILSTFKFLN